MVLPVTGRARVISNSRCRIHWKLDFSTVTSVTVYVGSTYSQKVIDARRHTTRPKKVVTGGDIFCEVPHAKYTENYIFPMLLRDGMPDRLPVKDCLCSSASGTSWFNIFWPPIVFSVTGRVKSFVSIRHEKYTTHEVFHCHSATVWPIRRRWMTYILTGNNIFHHWDSWNFFNSESKLNGKRGFSTAAQQRFVRSSFRLRQSTLVSNRIFCRHYNTYQPETGFPVVVRPLTYF